MEKHQQELWSLYHMLGQTAELTEEPAIQGGESRCITQFNNTLARLQTIDAVPDGLFDELPADASLGDISFACRQLAAFLAPSLTKETEPETPTFQWPEWTRQLKKDVLSIDKAAEIIAGLGIPGLVLLVAVSVSGVAGAAAITAGLTILGPGGILGGIVILLASTFIGSALAKFGFEELFKRVLDNLKEKGMTDAEILEKIEGYPISKELKRSLRESMGPRSDAS